MYVSVVWLIKTSVDMYVSVVWLIKTSVDMYVSVVSWSVDTCSGGTVVCSTESKTFTLLPSLETLPLYMCR